jgi:protoporphyrin/coproporphyrin ferrochelatase
MDPYTVVLFNLGGPDCLDAVEPFLFNLFSDHDIFRIPFGQRMIAGLISRRRAPKVRERYREIGGKSPINDWTEIQRTMLQEALDREAPGGRVYAAMRYWHPLIAEIGERLRPERPQQIVLLPLYPHYSVTTTGSAFNEWKRVFPRDCGDQRYVQAYFDHPKYIAAVNERIDGAMLRFSEEVRGDVRIVFSAHGTPVKFERQGDPYRYQIEQTVGNVMEARGFSHVHHLCYQSRVGPVKWLGPSVSDTIKMLAGTGQSQVLMVPISFVSDHIETLYELDIEYRALAEGLGVKHYRVTEGLNGSRAFIEALKEVALLALNS